MFAHISGGFPRFPFYPTSINYNTKKEWPAQSPSQIIVDIPSRQHFVVSLSILNYEIKFNFLLRLTS